MIAIGLLGQMRLQHASNHRVYGLEYYTNYILKQNMLYYVSLIIKWFFYIMFAVRRIENYSADFVDIFWDCF